MLRRQLLAAVPVTLAATAAQAAGGGDAAKSQPYVDLSPIALPVAVQGRLVNYVFVQLRLNLSSSADGALMRAKEPWFRDAIVRAAHRTPFTVASDYTRIDEKRVVASLLASARAIAGAGNFTSAQVMSQTPKQRQGLPTPARR